MDATVSVYRHIDWINIDTTQSSMDSRIKFREECMPNNPAATAPSITPVGVPRGLSGVVVTDTALGDVKGREGFYHYRQYSAVELAQTRGFEDVWHLLVHGELPDAANAALRGLPEEVRV